MSSIAEDALRLASSSRAALAARSRPSGSKPVTEEPPPEREGGFSGAMTLDRDSSRFFLPAPPNIVVDIECDKCATTTGVGLGCGAGLQQRY